MAILCGGSKWSWSLAQLPIQKAGAKADTGDSEEEKEEEAPESPFEVSLGKFLRGRLWFLILVFLLTACGAGYSYLVFTFADVADVPILGFVVRV
ncbi:hypothetical protein GOP47_0001556 [Adiantum capillus-veneris]|uniref:Uncharacterized protein n=1 Tax=Adiantum capillus-veneris TaxID=13818 RepID=A0A9D4V9X9_ADICA|nr:hypothetical protein GOP47_0001556 [Adiantum capillus-veneris]